MDRALLDYILCPACNNGDWTLEAAQCEGIPYSDGEREEVRSGELACACGKRYPIREFVLSFANLFPPDLEREAAFWNKFYIWNVEQGAVGFHDLRQGFAPFMAHGVREAFPYADTIDRYDVHQQVAEHPMLRNGRTLLDIGVGLGWTSLHFARSGYSVTAFDPSLRPVQAAKSYAIEHGVFIEYICAAVGYISFRPGSFDNVTAFHSLHHVPDIQAGLSDIQSWLRPGGTFALDEHVTNSKLAGAIGAALQTWAQQEVFPRYRTISDNDLANLPSEPHSALEDAGADQILPLVHSMFSVEQEKRRHVVLDHYPLLYYLWKDKDREAFVHALEIANHIQELLCQVDPDGGEYITIIAANNAPAANIDEPNALIADTSESELAESTPRQPDLEAAYAEQSAWATQLEASLRKQNTEVASLREQLKNIQRGKVMRLMSMVGKLKRRLL